MAAEYTMEVDVLRTARLTVQVRVQADSRVMAEDIARSAVRRAFESETQQVNIIAIGRPTYQVLTEVRDASRPGAA